MSNPISVPNGQQQIASYSPLRVIRPEDIAAHAGPVPGVMHVEAISGPTVGAQHLQLLRISVAPGIGVSPVHHHGASEAVFYGLHGCTTFFFGEGLRQRVDMSAGEFVFIPAWTIHAEANLGNEDAEMFQVCSTPEPTTFVMGELPVPEDLLR